MATTFQLTPVPAHELVYKRERLPKLRSTYGKHLDTSSVKWMRQTPITTNLEVMRRRFDLTGYIFVKNLMPRSDVLDMREAYFEHLAPTGILKPGTSPRDRIFNRTADPVAHHNNGGRDPPEDIEKVNRLISAHTNPIYAAFLEHSKLRQVVREFMGWKKDVLIKRTLLRHNFPNGFSTAIHYDKIFLRAGKADFLTAWVPIGACTAEGGGLMYLENSADIGMAMEADFASRSKDFTYEESVNGFNINIAKDGQLSHDV